MASSTPKTYQRLPGTGYRHMLPAWGIVLLFFVIGIFVLLFRGRRVQLWEGDDHLLVVEWDGYREYYKRFRYRDIQAFTVRKTAEGKIVNGILGGITIAFIALGLSVTDTGGRIAMLIIVGVLALFLLGNFLAGPTCQCHLRTAVQVEELPSLTRLRQTHKALARLRSRITGAQGEITAVEISVRMRELTGGTSATAGPQPALVAFPATDLPEPPSPITG